MQKTGTLSFDMGESKLDGEVLARKGAADPLGAATDFLQNRGFVNGEAARVTGDDGTVNTLSVFFITAAEHVGPQAALASRMRGKGRKKPVASKRSAGDKTGSKRGKKRRASAKQPSVKGPDAGRRAPKKTRRQKKASPASPTKKRTRKKPAKGVKKK